MFEVLEWVETRDTNYGCMLRTTPLRVVDQPVPFRIAWSKDGETRIGLVSMANRHLSVVKLQDLAPGDIVFLSVQGWKTSDFEPHTVLHVRP
jgi:hypothetical protein